VSEPRDEQILNRAYKIWEDNGKPGGREDEFYHQAERELREKQVERRWQASSLPPQVSVRPGAVSRHSRSELLRGGAFIERQRRIG
jgi:Protein of unknown function (DUF2934)